eukprot:6212033-Pleurochrysis_carterae.AAC.2
MSYVQNLPFPESLPYRNSPPGSLPDYKAAWHQLDLTPPADMARSRLLLCSTIMTPTHFCA